jgi:hypothetical protein
MIGTLMGVLIFVLVVAPFIYAILILTRLDAAAKKQKEAGQKLESRFMLVDIMSLIFMVGIPFKILDFDFGFGVSTILIVASLIAALAVWSITIKTVSMAGISTFGWRALVSMVLIPTMYFGCFYFGIVSANLIWGWKISAEATAWLVFSFVGMVASPWIVRGSLRSASKSVQVETERANVDPLAD